MVEGRGEGWRDEVNRDLLSLRSMNREAVERASPIRSSAALSVVTSKKVLESS